MQDLGGNELRKASHRKKISVLVRVAVALGALFLVFGSIEWGELKAAFANMNGWVFAGVLGVYMVSQVLLAVRWLLLVRAQGIDLQVITAVKLHFIGLYYNNVMPSSIGGDFLRAWYVSKHTNKRVEAALSVFVDRAVGLLGILLMAVFSYFFLFKGLDLKGPVAEESSGTSSVYGLLVNVCLVGSGVMVIILVFCAMSPVFRNSIKRVALETWQKLVILAKKGMEVVYVYWKRPIVLLLTLGLTLFLQSVTIWAFWLLGRDLGIEAGIKYYFVIFPGMWVVGALPISIAGVGVLEGGIAFLFARLAHVPLAQGTCLSLCQRFIWLISSIPGGIVHLMGRHLPETFSFDEGQEQG
jgi:uncharacterized protein (TIRG00374 family)